MSTFDVTTESKDRGPNGDVYVSMTVILKDREAAAVVARMFVQIQHSIQTYLTQNIKYGYSWRDDGLGPKSMFVASASKQARLLKLLWETPDQEVDVPKTVETVRDRIVYDLMMLLKIEDMSGPIDEVAVQREVDKT